ncbi:MAG: mannose-1-phosphate guanyltransferase [Chloroflexi bacterium]|nr:mannose-1-phosphate guanyltransferase [Chloroflexota bacterium]
MKAVVMAGGEGSRLRPLTIGRPKPLIPIVNKPCMEHVLELLKRHGIQEVIVTVQYLASQIQDYFGDGSTLGMKITYSVEDTPLGTAGSVKNAQSELSETFLVIGADALTDINLSDAIRFHREKKASATLTLYRVPNPLEYGVVITADDGRIRQFLEKPSWGEVFSDTVNTGIYVLEPSVLDYFEAGKSVDFSRDVFPQMLQRADALYGFVAGGYWCDVGNIQEFMRANFDVLQGKVALSSPLGIHLGGGIWTESEDIEISPSAQLFGPIFLGTGTKVKDECVIHGPAVIRRSTILDTGTHADSCIFWRDSYIGERAELRGAIVGRQCSIKARSMVFEGAVIGDDTIVGEGAIIQPNVKIWPNKEIERGATVTSSIIWGAQGRRVLFGRYGVSGLANIDLTPEFAARLGAAYGATLPRGSNVIMNRDPHRIPRMIKRAMISGLPSAGVDVLDIKSAPIPVARYVTRVSGAVGGVHVRLSPFDARVVDIKFFDAQGLDIDKQTERKIENTYFREDYRRVYLDEVGRISDTPGMVDLYAGGFSKALDLAGLARSRFNRKLIVDYANASSSAILPGLLNQMGVDVVSLNAGLDESQLARPSEEVAQAMQELAAIASVLKAGIGVRVDAGGERIAVVDDRGEIVPPFTVLAALAELVLAERPGGTIVVPVSAPHIFEQIAQKHGGQVVRTRVNAADLMAAAARDGVAIAGDGDGGVVFPELHPAIDGLFAVAKAVELLARQQVRLSAVVAELPRYFLTRGRVPCPWETKGKVMRLLSEQYRDRRVRQIDGVKIEMGREWVLVLPDADRPLFHIIAESTSMEGAHALMDKYSRLVSGLQH